MLDFHIVKQRGRLTVDNRFTCMGGELLALTGPSGAGKTTIIRILAGLEQPDYGYIQHDQECWYSSEGKICLKARERRVGYVFQEHTLFPHLNVQRNVAFACRDSGRVADLLDLLQIAHLAERRPQQISGGERQRAALAQALASDPQVLLLDEPFSALDRETRNRLGRELIGLKERLGIPIIMVTHDLEEAGRLADKQLCLMPEAMHAGANRAEHERMPAGLAPIPL